jgi:hypothetical protein
MASPQAASAELDRGGGVPHLAVRETLWREKWMLAGCRARSR